MTKTNENDKIDWTLWRSKTPPHTPEQVREYWKKFPKQTFNIGETAKKLAIWTRELDTTRFVTANCILPTSSFETGYTDVLDVVGFSYKEDKCLSECLQQISHSMVCFVHLIVEEE